MSVVNNINDIDNSQKLLNRKDTMYLSVINSQDAKLLPFKKLYTKRDWSSNLYNLDIECSQPRKFGIFTNKVDFINKLDDIEKAKPKVLFSKLNKPEFNLTNKDIEKSSPSVSHFKTNRVTNPLQPKYKFPEVAPNPIEIPKFIRDSIDIKDISGASPKKRINNLKKESLTEKLNSIEGSHPLVPYYRKNLGNIKYDYMDYSDLILQKFKTKRNVNILDPIYIFKKEDEEKSNFYGPIKKSKPESKYPYYYRPSLNLKIDDIKGTNPGSINYIKKFTGKNFEINVSDIPKTNAGSLKKGITTSRCLNPLVPEYQYLGEKEEKLSQNTNIIRLRKKQNSMPLISNNNDEKENTLNNKNDNTLEKINKNSEINKVDEEEKNKNGNFGKTKLFDRFSKFKINRFNINIIKRENELKKSNSAMNLINKSTKLENINNEKNKKIIRFTPLLKSRGKELINNTNISFDKTKFGKKPYPFYGYSHDPILLSKDSKERLEEIEKAKYEREVKKRKYEQYIFNKENNHIAEEYKKNPNDNNLAFISDNPNLVQPNMIHRKNMDEWQNINKIEQREIYSLKKKSKSLLNILPVRKLNSEKIDSFLNINSIHKNINERNNYSNLSSYKINPSEYTRKALLE